MPTEPKRPEVEPTCTNCGHASLHNVGAMGLCYKSKRPTQVGPGDVVKWGRISAEFMDWARP